MKKDDRATLVFCLSFALILMSIGAFIIFNYRNRILACTEVTEGEVLRIHKSSGGSGGVRPVVECTIDGQKVKLKSSDNKLFTSLKQGDIVIVHYNPKNGIMWIEGYDNHLFYYLLGTVFIIFGAHIGLLPYRIAIRRRRE